MKLDSMGTALTNLFKYFGKASADVIKVASPDVSNCGRPARPTEK